MYFWDRNIGGFGGKRRRSLWRFNVSSPPNIRRVRIKGRQAESYQAHLKTMTKGIPDCSFQHLPREDNQMGNALATLASTWEDQGRLSMRPLILTTASKPCHDAREVMDTEIDDGKPWYYDIQNYLERGELLEAADRKDRLAIQRLSSQFISVRRDVYKRQPNGVQLKCLGREEVDKVVVEIQGEVCGPDMSGLNLSRKIIRHGFY